MVAAGGDATGCCILGADVAALREFVADGETGRLVPFLDHERLADEAIALLGDASGRARLGGPARLWAERHLTLDAKHAAFDALVAEAMGVPLAGMLG